MNIKNQLLANYYFEKSTETFCDRVVYHKTAENSKIKLVTINNELIHYQDLPNYFNAHLIIYISRHSSKSGTPTLSVHTPGNLAEAHKGGIARKISVAPAKAMKITLLELMRQKTILDLDYQVTYEEDYTIWTFTFKDNNNTLLKSYDLLNHLFIPGEGQPTNTEYLIQGHVSEDVIKDISSWIKGEN